MCGCEGKTAFVEWHTRDDFMTGFREAERILRCQNRKTMYLSIHLESFFWYKDSPVLWAKELGYSFTHVQEHVPAKPTSSPIERLFLSESRSCLQLWWHKPFRTQQKTWPQTNVSISPFSSACKMNVSFLIFPLSSFKRQKTMGKTCMYFPSKSLIAENI